MVIWLSYFAVVVYIVILRVCSELGSFSGSRLWGQFVVNDFPGIDEVFSSTSAFEAVNLKIKMRL